MMLLGFGGTRISRVGAHLVFRTKGTVLARDIRGHLSGARDAGADFVYGDSIHFGPGPGSYFHQLRPGWSPERLRSHCYVGDVVAASPEVVRAAGGRRFLARLSSHDRALRLSEKAVHPMHVKELLYASNHETRMPSADVEATRGHCARTGIEADCTLANGGSVVRVSRVRRGSPRVAVVIPTRGSSTEVRGESRVMVVDAVRGLLNDLSYGNVEILVVADVVTPGHIRDELQRIGGEKLRIIDFEGEFNFARKINLAAVQTGAEYLLLVNDDIEIVSTDIIEELLSYMEDDTVGLVGPLLTFEDGTVQSAGHLLNPAPFDLYRGYDPALCGGYNILHVAREVSSVLAAFAMTRRSDFLAVGGLSPMFPGDYNDVDYALKLAKSGKRTIYTPHARCIHFESKTRRAAPHQPSIDLLGHRWRHVIENDPYGNTYLQRHEFIWKSNVDSPESLSDALGAEAEWDGTEWERLNAEDDPRLHRTRYFPRWVRMATAQ
ncbi:MAG: glycosyltransferase family 2 protein [Acidimicrobiales bacterium]